MKHLVFLLEEPSMQILLEELLPKLLPDNIPCYCLPHEGVTSLKRSIPRKLRGWGTPGAQFIILRDQHGADCHQVKQELQQLCKEAGRPDALVRIVCHELEGWFLGDLPAIAKAFNLRRISSNKRTIKKYQHPDRFNNAPDELKKLLKRYKKIEGARRISPHLDPAQNKSHSFQVFIDGIRNLLVSGQ